MSREKILHLKALGAEVRLTRSDVAKGHPEYYQDLARSIAAQMPGAFYIDQFNNPANAWAHENGTGPEIWRQLEQRVDAVVVGVGSGGTLGGLTRFFQRVAPQLEMVLADPVGSVLADYVESGHYGEAGSWLVEGIGEDFVPALADFALVKRAYRISDAESLHTARLLLQQEGVLAGSSSGTLLAAALRYCREQTQAKRVLTFVCDSGNKYLSKMFNDYWMIDQGLIERPKTGNLRDLIARRYDEGTTVTCTPDESLAAVYGRMRFHDIDQVPVMDGERVVGLIDEWDLLRAVKDAPEHFQLPVRQAMVSKLQTLGPDVPLERLLQTFDEGHVALIVEQGRFLGLITKSDVLNLWRRTLR
jgi:cystathionine beta-synthase